MKRITTLGAAVSAVLLITAALGVASASATRFVADQYSATVKVEDNFSMSFGVGASSATCSASAGSSYGTATLAAPATAVSVTTPASFTCTGPNSPTLKATGCKFTYDVNSKTFALSEAGCSLAFSFSALKCTYKMGPQSVSATLAASGSPSTVSANVNSGLVLSQVEGTLCGAKAGEKVNYSAAWKLSATKSGSPIGLSYSDKVGVFYGPEDKFGAEVYPLAVAGQQGAETKHAITLGILPKITCESVKFSSWLSGATASLPVSGAYSGCSSAYPLFGAMPVTIDMGSCEYLFHGGTPEGTVDIACAEEAEPMTIKVFNKTNGAELCHYQIKGQTGLKGAWYGTIGGGIDSGLGITMNLSGVSYKRVITGGSCGSGETGSGTYTGGSALYQA